MVSLPGQNCLQCIYSGYPILPRMKIHLHYLSCPYDLLYTNLKQYRLDKQMANFYLKRHHKLPFLNLPRFHATTECVHHMQSTPVLILEFFHKSIYTFECFLYSFSSFLDKSYVKLENLSCLFSEHKKGEMGGGSKLLNTG